MASRAPAQMTAAARYSQRVAAITLALVAPLVVWRPAMDDFQLPKAAVIVIGAAVIVAAGVYNAVITQRITLPPVPVVLALSAFVGALLLATISSDALPLSLVGAYKRYAGLALYLTYVVLFVGAWVAVGRRHTLDLLRAILLAGAVVAAYAGLQALGVDPLLWESDEIISTLGNPNFVSAYLAIVLPVALGLALTSQLGPTWRRVAAAISLMALLALAAAGSVQGFVAGAVGVGVVLGAWASTSLNRRARIAVHTALLGGLAVGGAVVSLGIARIGPLRQLGNEWGIVLRGDYWRAAFEMAVDSPLLGVGLGRYGAYYRAYRSPAAAARVDVTTGNDSPHNVILGMFAEGGLLLGLTYVAVLAVVAWFAYVGWRTVADEGRLTFSAVAGAAAAYVTQSLVSIDVPPLAVTGWVLFGVIVAYGSTTTWTLGENRTRKVSRVRRRIGLLSAGALVTGSAALAYVGLSADVAAQRASRAVVSGAPGEALEASERAVERAPWETTYWLHAANANLAVDNFDEAEAALRQAVRRDPRDLSTLVTLARVLAEGGRDASDAYEQVLQVDPHAHALREEAAAYFRSIGMIDRAASLEAPPIQ